jgi:hypothetical protein
VGQRRGIFCVSQSFCSAVLRCVLRTAFCVMRHDAHCAASTGEGSYVGLRCNTVHHVATQPDRLQHRATRRNAETARRPLRSVGWCGRQPAVCDATAAVDRAGPPGPIGLARVRRAVRTRPPCAAHTVPRPARGNGMACGSPLPHLHRDWAHPFPICTGTGLTPSTSAPGLGSPFPHLHRGLHVAWLYCTCSMRTSH